MNKSTESPTMTQFREYPSPNVGLTKSSGEDLHCIAESTTDRKERTVRKLIPLECERLMGYPDGWTDIPGASDSKKYRALGNSVAVPCVDFILCGIAYFLSSLEKKEEEDVSVP